MTRREIARRRLANQFLLDTSHRTARDVVAALGAVQAQDYPGAKWGIAQRTCGLGDADIDRALAEGSIVRTHVLRPTWHLVARDDVRWMLGLTAPRLLSGMRARHRQLEIDDALRRRAGALLANALRDERYLTRNEIAAIFTRARIDLSDRQRLAHLLYLAELEMLICNGPPRGKQQTYALFDERVPARAPRQREEAVVDLVRRYFTTRGPATVHDFAWWSGLTTGDARRALAVLGGELEQTSIDGRSYWFAPQPPPARTRVPRAHLLPNYDEFFIGFRDRSAILDAAERAGVKEEALSIFAHVVFVDGQVVGSWRRVARGPRPIQVTLLLPATKSAGRGIEAEVERYRRFLAAPAPVA